VKTPACGCNGSSEVYAFPARQYACGLKPKGQTIWLPHCLRERHHII
jgi:hypothetical protein